MVRAYSYHDHDNPKVEVTPYRHLAVLDSESHLPVCAECRHSVYHGSSNTNYAEDWRCKQEPWEIIRPGYKDPITGETFSEIRKVVRCLDKNGEGQCTDFEVRPRALKDITKPKRNWFQLWVLKLGAWLIAKAGLFTRVVGCSG